MQTSRTVGLSGWNELQKTLQDLPLEISGPLILRAFRAGAKIIVEGAQRRAPTGDRSDEMLSFNRAAVTKKRSKSKFISKKIRECISIKSPSRKLRGATEIILMVVCRHPLASIFENGTVERVQETTGRRTGRIKAQPFMRPSLDIDGEASIGTIEDILKDGIEKAGASLAAKNRSV